jgi:hypothetical protein
MIEGFAVRDVNACPAAAERGERRQGARPFRRFEQEPQGGLDELRDGRALCGGFLPQPRHDGVVDNERGFHMGNHIEETEVRQQRHSDQCAFRPTLRIDTQDSRSTVQYTKEETPMPKGQQRPGKMNKPKLSTKEKQRLKKEKRAAKGK